jgi:hypothetical protein
VSTPPRKPPGSAADPAAASEAVSSERRKPIGATPDPPDDPSGAEAAAAAAVRPGDTGAAAELVSAETPAAVAGAAGAAVRPADVGQSAHVAAEPSAAAAATPATPGAAAPLAATTPDDAAVDDLRPRGPAAWLRGWLREPPSFWLTRFWLLRLLGLVYLAAFLSLAQQFVALVGSDGLLPVQPLLEGAAERYGSAWVGFWKAPSVFWLGAPDAALSWLAWLGVALSIVVVAGYANAIVLAVLWLLYFSFVTVGQDWFAYGWDIQLCETGFLAIFLVPLFDGRAFPRRRPPKLVILLFRWLVLRVMLGAGLIKLRGDPCWQDLSCLVTHFETQPLPNPLSRAFHLLPEGVHAFGVILNHVAELIAPLCVFGPRRVRHIAGLVMVGFQVMLIVSGNLALLNWLTLVAIVACFDDELLGRVTPGWLRRRAAAARAAASSSRGPEWCAAALFGLYLLLAVQPVANLLSSEQRMNHSFNRWHLSGAYGAFGSMIGERYEIVLEGSPDAADAPGRPATWREYDLPCKPGDPVRRPCIAAPYHHRLDWQMWFASRSDLRGHPWVAHLVWKLLHNDPAALRLMARNPFPDRPPRRVRALLYRYRFADPDDPSGAWWRRERAGTWMRPVAADDPALISFLEQQGWLPRAAPRAGPRIPPPAIRSGS